MEAVIARGIQVLLALGGAYVVALWFVLIVWTFRDIETRSKSVVTQVFSTLLVVLFFVPGVLLYMILRPKETLDVAFQRSLEEEYLLQDLEELPVCMNCQHYVEDDFMLCPHCQTQLREACTHCARLVDLRWNLCPYCGTEQARSQEPPVEQVPEVAARWVAPAALRRKIVRQLPAASPVPQVDGDAAEPAAALSAVPDVTAPLAPVRLFDRRKTREAARFSNYRRPVVVNGNGTVHPSAPLVDQHGRVIDGGEPAVREIIVEPSGVNGNGRHVADPVSARTPLVSEETGD